MSITLRIKSLIIKMQRNNLILYMTDFKNDFYRKLNCVHSN
jgi:hypothetical protein